MKQTPSKLITIPHIITTNTDPPSYANGRLNNVSDILLLKPYYFLNKFSINFKARFSPFAKFSSSCYMIDVLSIKGNWPATIDKKINVAPVPGSYRAKYPDSFSAYDNLRNEAYTYPCSPYSGYNSVHTYNLVCDNNQWTFYSDDKKLVSFNNTNSYIFIGIANYLQKTYSENASENNHELYWLTVTNTPQSKLPAIQYLLDEKENNMYGIQKE